MPRNMSFSLTTPQILNRTKTVTRRKGWADLKPGTILNACVKCQGLKKGKKVEKLCQIRVVKNASVKLWDISAADVVREGFPGMTPAAFVDMFCAHMGGCLSQIVNRIEFEYV